MDLNNLGQPERIPWRMCTCFHYVPCIFRLIECIIFSASMHASLFQTFYASASLQLCIIFQHFSSNESVSMAWFFAVLQYALDTKRQLHNAL